MFSIEKKINENIHSNTFNTYPLKNGMHIVQKLSLPDGKFDFISVYFAIF